MSYLKKYYKYKLKQLGGSLVTPQDKLLSSIISCAQNGFVSEVKPFRNLTRLLRNDDQLLAVNNQSLIRETRIKTYLMAAAFSGDIVLVTKLLKYSNINAINQLGETALMLACENGKNDVVIFLLNNGANININQHGKTAFLLACENCNLEVITRFLQLGANIQDIGQFGNTTLMLALKGGNIDIILFLLQQGVNVNATNQSGNTALILACETGRIDIINLLLENGATFNPLDRAIPNILLKMIKDNNMTVFRFLIERGVNANAVSHRAETALMLASKYGRLDMVKLLITNHADVNRAIEDEMNYSGEPIPYRNLIRDGEAVVALLDPFHIVPRTTSKSMRAYALWKYNTSLPKNKIYMDIYQILTRRGSDVSNIDNIGMTALMYAIQYKQLEIVDYLCANGAIVNGMMKEYPEPRPQPLLPRVQLDWGHHQQLAQLPPPPQVQALPIPFGQVIPEEEDLYP
jgi:ankyrin repeat protein